MAASCPLADLDGLKPSSLNQNVLNSKPAVLDVLFPEVRAKLLRLLFTTPPKQQYVRELMIGSGLCLHTVQDELRKLYAIGLVTNWSNGYKRFYQTNHDHPLYPQLSRIVQLSETLPRTRALQLRRPRGRRAAKRRNRGKPLPLPTDRPIKWHLFSKRVETRRL